MTAFAGDSIALTFTADLSQARAAYDQFLADVSRRPVPVQFQGGGAAAAVGASISNAPGIGSGGQWATGATASAAAISGAGIVRAPGTTAPQLQAAGGPASALSAGTVTINAATVNIVSSGGGAAAATAEAEAAAGVDAAGVGGVASRRRGGTAFGGLGTNRQIFALSLAAAAQVAHTSDAVEDARFATAHTNTLSQYYGSKAAEWQALFSGPAGAIGRFVLDRVGPSRYAPTPNIQGFQERAFDAQSNEFLDNLQEHITGQRMRRLGYEQGLRTGGTHGARTGETLAGIRAASHAERMTLERQIRDREAINADLQGRSNLTPAEARAINQRNIEIGSLRQAVRENETTEQGKVNQFQFDQRIHDVRITQSVGSRGYAASLRAQGRVGEAGEADFERSLADYRRQHADESQGVRDVVEQTISQERLARAQDNAYQAGQTNLGARGLEFQLARDPLNAKLARIGQDQWEAMRNAATPEQQAAVQREFTDRRELAKQQDADERTSARGRLNVENAGLAILANGPGTYAERQTAAAASDIYGQTLLASLAALQGGRPELLGGLKRRGQLQLQSLQQQLLAGFRSEEVDLNRVAVSNPQGDLEKIAAIQRAVEQIPSKLDDISAKLDGFDQVQ